MTINDIIKKEKGEERKNRKMSLELTSHYID